MLALPGVGEADAEPAAPDEREVFDVGSTGVEELLVGGGILPGGLSSSYLFEW